MNNFLNRLRAAAKARKQKACLEAIRGAFAITERCGKMVITHNGTAILELNSEATANDALQTLEQVRLTAEFYSK